MDLDGIRGDIQRGKYEFDTHGQPIPELAKLSSVATALAFRFR